MGSVPEGSRFRHHSGKIAGIEDFEQGYGFNLKHRAFHSLIPIRGASLPFSVCVSSLLRAFRALLEAWMMADWDGS